MALKLSADPRLPVVVAVLAVSGCGGEEAAEPPVSGRTTPAEATATPSPATTPSPTATPGEAPDTGGAPARPPEEVEGGGGDEAGIEQTARFVVGAGGAVRPPRIEVAAFLPVRLALVNRSGETVRIEMPTLGAEPVELLPGRTEDVALSGPQPGDHEIRAGDAVAVLEAIPGGAG